MGTVLFLRSLSSLGFKRYWSSVSVKDLNLSWTWLMKLPDSTDMHEFLLRRKRLVLKGPEDSQPDRDLRIITKIQIVVDPNRMLVLVCLWRLQVGSRGPCATVATSLDPLVVPPKMQ